MSQRTNIIRMRRRLKPWLCFTAREPSTIALVKVGSPTDVSLVTSLNGGAWQSYTTGDTISLSKGDKLRMRAATTNSAMANSTSNYHNFVMTGSVSASGVVMSLLDSTLNSKILKGNNALNSLFKGCVALVRAPRLGFYRFGGPSSCVSMFQDCTGLVDVPALDIQVMGYQSCVSMFKGCTALVNAPYIDTTINHNSCGNMFENCTSLVNANNITLRGATKGYDFSGMFKNCSSLRTIPHFNVTYDVINATFENIFEGCSSLVDASSLIIRQQNGTLKNSFFGCSSLQYPPRIEFNGIAAYGLYHTFQNCISLVDARNISIIGDFNGHALEGAFAGCSSLKYPPALTMNTALGDQTWVAAFSNCSSLEEITLDFPATSSAQWQSNTFQYCLTNCNAITDITLTWEEWPSAAGSQFSWPNKSGVTLHVKPTLDITNLSTYSIPASWTVVQDVVGE